MTLRKIHGSPGEAAMGLIHDNSKNLIKGNNPFPAFPILITEKPNS